MAKKFVLKEYKIEEAGPSIMDRFRGAFAGFRKGTAPASDAQPAQQEPTSSNTGDVDAVTKPSAAQGYKDPDSIAALWKAYWALRKKYHNDFLYDGNNEKEDKTKFAKEYLNTVHRPAGQRPETAQDAIAMAVDSVEQTKHAQGKGPEEPAAPDFSKMDAFAKTQRAVKDLEILLSREQIPDDVTEDIIDNILQAARGNKQNDKFTLKEGKSNPSIELLSIISKRPTEEQKKIVNAILKWSKKAYKYDLHFNVGKSLAAAIKKLTAEPAASDADQQAATDAASGATRPQPTAQQSKQAATDTTGDKKESALDEEALLQFAIREDVKSNKNVKDILQKIKESFKEDVTKVRKTNQNEILLCFNVEKQTDKGVTYPCFGIVPAADNDFGDVSEEVFNSKAVPLEDYLSSEGESPAAMMQQPRDVATSSPNLPALGVAPPIVGQPAQPAAQPPAQPAAQPASKDPLPGAALTEDDAENDEDDIKNTKVDEAEDYNLLLNVSKRTNGVIKYGARVVGNPKDLDNEFKLSFPKRYAQNKGVEYGDIITFDTEQDEFPKIFSLYLAYPKYFKFTRISTDSADWGVKPVKYSEAIADLKKQQPLKENIYAGLFDKFIKIERKTPTSAPFKMNSKGIFKIKE